MSEVATIEWLDAPLKTPDPDARKAAEARQATLTKPSGALGRLEDIAIHLAALQNSVYPSIERVNITVFVGDHGVAAEGVSAFPQTVTAEMLRNFSRGGAAINVAACAVGAGLEVVNLGTAHNTGPLNRVRECALGPGTANMARAPAMTEQQLANALTAGRDAAKRASSEGADLFIGGEMGIANTTAATALACSLLNAPPSLLAGPGTGLDGTGVGHKAQVVQRALELHSSHITSPLEALRRVGGFEIAALAGAYIASACLGQPVLVDGFISSAAALTAVRLRPGVEDWLLFSHTSAEPGHRILLEALAVHTLLDLDMRLGEGTGAAVAVPLLRMACALHKDMATFAEARVSEKL